MKIFRSEPGSTTRLIQYANLYFLLYALFGMNVKYFQGARADGFPGLTDVEFLVYSTLGSAVICLGVILFAGWWKFEWRAREIFYIFLSGTCTALVIPTTTLMYSLPISVMVAMVIMRGSVIVVSRCVDSLMIWQGLSKKRVSWEENVAALIAVTAVGIYLFFARSADFDFVNSSTAMAILITYIAAYSLRIYLMNYFKFTRSAERKANNLNYFAVEQLSASLWIFGVVGFVVAFPQWLWGLPHPMGAGLESFRQVMVEPHEQWKLAALAGVPFGFSAFFSVFLFMFEGRTSTFAGLVNRLTSLLAGTTSTLLFAFIFNGKWPKTLDWASFGLILLAVYFLGRAEKKLVR